MAAVLWQHFASSTGFHFTALCDTKVTLFKRRRILRKHFLP